jgi:pyridoxamine 5'-phosphate oxidase
LIVEETTMELKDCLTFANEHPVCYLATEEGDQPRVRPLLMWFADERGFYFMTMSPKSLSQQLHANPKVEICFYNGADELPDARMMRVSGEVEFVDDAGLTRRVAEERGALEGIIGRPLEPLTEVFRLRTGKAWFWGLTDILKEPRLERVVF